MKSLVITLIAAAAVTSGVSAQTETETVGRNYNRVIIHHKDGSRVCYDFNDIARIEHTTSTIGSELVTCGKNVEEITDKSAWSIPYGTLAMQFGPFSQMIDGKDTDGGGWMSFINDGFKGAPGLGKPFVVVDLGKSENLASLGIMAGNPNGGFYDVLPARVDFYITDRQEGVNIDLTDDERKVLEGSDGDNYEEYFAVHDKIVAADAQTSWRKIGSVLIKQPQAEEMGKYFYILNNAQLEEGVSSRYVKLVVTPFATGKPGAGDRSKIFEFYAKRVTD